MLRSDPRIHYKMYKAKKNMVYAALFSFAVLGGLSLSQNAKADTVENNNVTPTVQTTVNSAQSTTGATPQSMPTQSAVPTQSPVASLNTVNSISTSQPVSAQPVVNNQANSASNVSNQTPMTTLNAQSARPARNLAVTRQANLYAQSLIQTNTQTPAQNVQLHAYINNGNANIHDQNYFTTEHPVSLGIWSRVTASGQFDVDASQLKAGNKILIATITQKPEYYDTIKTIGTTPAYFKSQQIGQYQTSQVDPNTIQLSLVLSKSIDAVGTQHFSFNNVQFAAIHTNDGNADWSKLRGHSTPYTDYALAGNGLNDQFRINYRLDPYTYLPQASATPELSPNSFTSAGDASFSITGLNLGFDDSQGFNGETKFIQSNGKDNSAVVNTGDKVYGVYIHQPKNNTWIPWGSWTTIESHAPYVTSDGKVSYDYSADLLATAPRFNITDAGSGLTFAQLASKNIEGASFSQQANGDYIYCWRLPRNKMQFSDSTAENNLKRGVVFNAVDPSDQAVQNSINFWNNNIKHMPTQTYIGVHGYMADPTVKSTIKADLINVDGYQPPKPITMVASTVTTSSMASGQAAVKLHVINATNGTELNQWSKLMSEA